MDRLYEAGLEWIDVQTVSNFSASIKARLIPLRLFELLRDTQRPTGPDLTTPWIPRVNTPPIILRPNSVSYEYIGPPQK